MSVKLNELLDVIFGYVQGHDHIDVIFEDGEVFVSCRAFDDETFYDVANTLGSIFGIKDIKGYPQSFGFYIKNDKKPFYINGEADIRISSKDETELMKYALGFTSDFYVKRIAFNKTTTGCKLDIKG